MTKGKTIKTRCELCGKPFKRDDSIIIVGDGVFRHTSCDIEEKNMRREADEEAQMAELRREFDLSALVRSKTLDDEWLKFMMWWSVDDLRAAARQARRAGKEAMVAVWMNGVGARTFDTELEVEFTTARCDGALASQIVQRMVNNDGSKLWFVLRQRGGGFVGEDVKIHVDATIEHDKKRRKRNG